MSAASKAAFLAAVLTFAASTDTAFTQDRPEEDWHVVEADNGARFGIEMNSISHYTNGSASAAIYAIEGETYNPRNLKRILFDCQGNYTDLHGRGGIHYAPPRSVIAELGRIACAGARDRRHEE